MGVTFTIGGGPPPAAGTSLYDAWMTWVRASNSVIDRNREKPGSSKALTLCGVPGHIWEGHVSAIRALIWPAGQPSREDGGPYTVAKNASESEREHAAQNWRNVQHLLTNRTANMVCIERHGYPTPSIWWVRDEFSATVITADQYDAFRSEANAPLAPRPPALTPPPVPMPAFTPPSRPAPSITAPAPYRSVNALDAPGPCRYHLATGCTAVYADKSALFYHEERSATHESHRIDLVTCPLCDTGTTGTAIGRNSHLDSQHGIGARSAARRVVDAEQTKALWDLREAQRGHAPALAPAAPAQEVDADVDAVVKARRPAGPQAPAPVQAPVAPAPPADGEDPRIAGLRALIKEYDAAASRVSALETENAELKIKVQDGRARLQLARETLAQVDDL